MFPKLLVVRNELAQQFMSELLGTFVLVTMVDLGAGLATVQQASGVGAFVPALAMSNGLGVMMGVLVSSGVSGAHLNPAVSLALFSLRQLRAAQAVAYQLAQYCGGFLGGLLVYLLYHQLLDPIDGGVRQASGPNSTVGIFVTLPGPGVGLWVAFADQVANTMLLLLTVRAITDPNNSKVPPPLQPLLVGLTVVGIISAEVIVSGTCMNPARDFGPRLSALVVGYGVDVFSANDFYFWVPLVGPYVGALLGAWLYELAVGQPLAHRAAQEQQLHQLQDKRDVADGDVVAMNLQHRGSGRLRPPAD